MHPPPFPSGSFPASILLLATKGTVLAMDRATGRRLWQTPLVTGWTSGDFVSLLADETRVFAHTKGSVYCLDLATGQKLWEDGLSGLGYNLASLAFPGGANTGAAGPAEEQRRRSQDSAHHSQSHGHS